MRKPPNFVKSLPADHTLGTGKVITYFCIETHEKKKKGHDFSHNPVVHSIAGVQSQSVRRQGLESSTLHYLCRVASSFYFGQMQTSPRGICDVYVCVLEGWWAGEGKTEILILSTESKTSGLV